MIRTILVICLLTSFVNGQSFSNESVVGVIVFRDANVLTMVNSEVLERHSVVIRGDKIVGIGPNDQVHIPDEAMIIDASDKYLLPGLAEMHGHIPPPSSDPEYINNVLFLYLANGITTVRGMLGWPGQLDLRNRVQSGDLLSPHLYLAGPSFNGQSISSPDQAERMVHQQVEEGWDLLKIHPGLTRAEYDAIASTANALNVRFGGHVPAEVGIEHALESRQETFDHLDGYIEYLDGLDGPMDENELQQIVAKTKENGAWVVPTMALWETLYLATDLSLLTSYDELKYMPPAQVQQWRKSVENRFEQGVVSDLQTAFLVQNRLHLLKVMQDEGVRILMGTDAPQLFSVPGFSLHRELKRMQAAGLTPYEILVSGTVNVGDYFERYGKSGKVALDHRADLILVDDNPLSDLENLKNPVGVMVSGKWIDRSEIQFRLQSVASQYN